MSYSNPIAGLCMHAAFSMARCPSVVAHSKDQACIAFCWVGDPGSRGVDDRGRVTYECDDWVTIDPLSTSCLSSFLSYLSQRRSHYTKCLSQVQRQKASQLPTSHSSS